MPNIKRPPIALPSKRTRKITFRNPEATLNSIYMAWMRCRLPPNNKGYVFHQMLTELFENHADHV